MQRNCHLSSRERKREGEKEGEKKWEKGEGGGGGDIQYIMKEGVKNKNQNKRKYMLCPVYGMSMPKSYVTFHVKHCLLRGEDNKKQKEKKKTMDYFQMI